MGRWTIGQEKLGEVRSVERTCWKIETEDIDPLETNGDHLEYNFGHGTRHHSRTLVPLNMLAFLFHAVLELLDTRCTMIRRTLPPRDTDDMTARRWQQRTTGSG
jgi:hypothetical protein